MNKTHKTIVVINRKGGVGKTTISTHLAAGLALMGFRTALIDTDPQGHSASAFGMPKENGLYKVMVNEAATFSDVMRLVDPAYYMVPGWESENPADDQNLYLLPSDKSTALVAGEQPSYFRFRRMVKDMAKLLKLDYVIVDSGPSNSMFDGSRMFAADYVLLVTETNAFSFDGVTEALAEIDQMNREAAEFLENPVKLLGIVPNKARFSTNNHRENIQMLADEFGLDNVWSPITLRTVWEQATEYGQLVYSYAPYGQEYADAWRMVERACKELGAIERDIDLMGEVMKGAEANVTA